MNMDKRGSILVNKYTEQAGIDWQPLTKFIALEYKLLIQSINKEIILKAKVIIDIRA